MGPNRWALACGLAAATLSIAATAQAAVSHTVQPGETLWSIAAANGLTTSSVASFNGIAEDGLLIAGSTIQIPTAAQDTGVTTSAAPASGWTYGLGTIPSPYGDLQLDPVAADSWNAMRAEALSTYGVDLYPGGTLSAYRTYEQQAYLYDLYLSGQGSPANPPGTSSHEFGGAVDLATQEMRLVVDAIGPAYGWYAPHDNEWWHVEWG